MRFPIIVGGKTIFTLYLLDIDPSDRDIKIGIKVWNIMISIRLSW